MKVKMAKMDLLIASDAESEVLLRFALRLTLRLLAVVIVICLIVSFLSAPVNLTFSTGKPVVCNLDVCHFFGFHVANGADIAFVYELLFALAALIYIGFRYLVKDFFRVSYAPVVLYHPPEN